MKMETVRDILRTVRTLRPLSRPHLYAKLAELGIRSKRRQRPAFYPAGTAEKILRHYGFSALPQVVPIRQLRTEKGTARR